LIYINVMIFVLFLLIAWAWLRFLGAPADSDRRMDVEPVSNAVQALWEHRWAVLGALGVFVGIYVVFYTNLMTNPAGLGGLFEGIRYWLTQDKVARGDQPWFYYLLLLGPIYEPLAIFTGVAFLIAMLVKIFRGSASWPADLPMEAYEAG